MSSMKFVFRVGPDGDLGVDTLGIELGRVYTGSSGFVDLLERVHGAVGPQMSSVRRERSSGLLHDRFSETVCSDGR